MTDILTFVANITRTFAALPPAIMEPDTVLDEVGEELALVGGLVRDVFLGAIPHDSDMTTSVRPEHTGELLAQWGNTTWDIGREFGTIGGRRGDLVVEVMTYRIGEYETGPRKSKATFGDTLEGDLTHRDFMVNAMAMRLPQMALIDPCGGFADPADGNLRTPVSAKQSSDDDPLRIMRAARFSAQLGLDVDMDVINMMETMASRLEIVPAERIRVELECLIISPYPHRGIELMVHTGVADVVPPEVTGLVSTAGEHKRHKDVYEYTLTVVEQVMDLETDSDGAVPAPDFILCFAALMRDVGKPTTRRFKPNGAVSFHHREVVGTKMTRKRMKALHFDKVTIEVVSNLVTLHLRLYGYGGATRSDSAVRRYVVDADDFLECLHRLICVGCATRNRHKANYLLAAYDDFETRIAVLRGQEELDAIRPDPNGDQIMEILGLCPSRAVKVARDYLLELRMGRGPLGEETARQALLDWWASDDVRIPAEEYQAWQVYWEARVAEKKAHKVAAKAAREVQGQ